MSDLSCVFQLLLENALPPALELCLEGAALAQNVAPRILMWNVAGKEVAKRFCSSLWLGLLFRLQLDPRSACGLGHLMS